MPENAAHKVPGQDFSAEAPEKFLKPTFRTQWIEKIQVFDS